MRSKKSTKIPHNPVRGRWLAALALVALALVLAPASAASTLSGERLLQGEPAGSTAAPARPAQQRSPVSMEMDEAAAAVGRGNYTEAIHHYHRVLELDPSNQEAKLWIARVLSWSKNYDDAIVQYDVVLAATPGHLEARMEKARVLSWTRRFDESLAEYERVLKVLESPAPGGEVRPRAEDVRLEYARVLSWAGRYPEATAQFDLLLPQGSTPQEKDVPVLVERGRVLSWQRRYSEATANFEQALVLAPGNRDARLGKAQSLLWSGQGRSARPMLQDLHREKPEDPSVLITLASAENQAGRPDRALHLLDSATAAEPGNTDATSLRDQIRAGLRPELRLSWGYGHDIDRLNNWRNSLDLRFNFTPRIRNFVTIDYLPTSGPAGSFGYAVVAAPGQGPCPLASPVNCTFFASQVPVQPFVPAPQLLGVTAFPNSVLLEGNDRVFQSAVQIRFGAQMQVNEWFRWSGSIGAITLRHGSLAGNVPGFPRTRTLLVYSVSPTFMIGSNVELSLGAAREYVPYTPKALAQTIHYDEFNAGVVWRLDSLTRVNVSGFARWFSPQFEIPLVGSFPGGTTRLTGGGANWSVTRKLLRGEWGDFEAGYDATMFGYSRPSGLPDENFYVNPGLFTPNFYQRHSLLLRNVWKPANYFTWTLHGTIGPQQVFRNSDLSLSTTAGTRLDFRISPRATFSLSYDYLNSPGFFQTLVLPAQTRGYHSHYVASTLLFRF